MHGEPAEILYVFIRFLFNFFLSVSNQLQSVRHSPHYGIVLTAFRGSRVVPCGQTDSKRDVMNLILVFRNCFCKWTIRVLTKTNRFRYFIMHDVIYALLA